MPPLSDDNQTGIIAFNPTSRYLDYLLNIDHPYFEGTVNQFTNLSTNVSDTCNETFILDLHLSISNGFVSSKSNDKRDDFDFDIIKYPFLDGNVPRSVYEGCQKSSWTLMIKASNEPEFDLHYYISLM